MRPAFAWLLMTAACSPQAPCPVAGDLSRPPSLTATQRLPDGGAEDVRGTLYLQVPAQGGHVVFVGARVQNLAACGLELSAALVDPMTNRLETEEKRRVDLGPGFMSDPGDTANFANVPACPNFGTRDISGPQWNLVVEAKQRDGRTASATLPVVLSCETGGADCACECAAGYVLGKCGRRDGG